MNPSNENMSETGVRNNQPKDSRLGDLSAVFAICAIATALATGPSLLCAAFAIAGLAFGIIGLWQINRSRGKLKGFVPAICGIVVNCALILVILNYGFYQKPPLELAHRVVCGTNLSRLGKAIQNYGGANRGKYPAAHKWCNLLLEGNYVTDKVLRCKGALAQGYEAKCHYAMNPNCEPNSPGDIVLLFESKGGWNQFGGPELLAPENHGGKGCNILFNDGHVMFVYTEGLGELKWK